MPQTLAAFRQDKDDAFKNEGYSPLTSEQKTNFKGLNYYPENLKFIFHNVLIKPVNAGQFVEMPTSVGDREKYERAGLIRIPFDGKEYQLHVYKDIGEDTYFLPIKDATSGNETYKNGRYLDIEVAVNKIPILDFNYAYNPYCAYNHNWRCPITPQENSLPIKIEAGEKNFI